MKSTMSNLSTKSNAIDGREMSLMSTLSNHFLYLCPSECTTRVVVERGERGTIRKWVDTLIEI